MRFKDKVAIVTGGAQGIGREISRLLACEGASIAVFDISSKLLDLRDDILVCKTI